MHSHWAIRERLCAELLAEINPVTFASTIWSAGFHFPAQPALLSHTSTSSGSNTADGAAGGGAPGTGSSISGQHGSGTASGNGTAGNLNGGGGTLPTNSPMFGLKSTPSAEGTRRIRIFDQFPLAHRGHAGNVFGTGETSRTGGCEDETEGTEGTTTAAQ